MQRRLYVTFMRSIDVDVVVYHESLCIEQLYLQIEVFIYIHTYIHTYIYKSKVQIYVKFYEEIFISFIQSALYNYVYVQLIFSV